MADEKKIDELVKTAIMAELDGVEFIQDFDYATLRREYNGIGPEWAGENIRGYITRHFGLFEPAALIHDLRNYRSDGSREKFEAANDEFLKNCLTLVNYSFPWFRLKRYTMRGVALGMYDFVSGPGGWAAWHDCHEKNKVKVEGEGEQRKVTSDVLRGRDAPAPHLKP